MKIRYAHIQVPTAVAPYYKFGRLTLAWDGEYLGWSWCSPKDQFIRAKGRMIAEGRMTKGKQAFAPPDPGIWIRVAVDVLTCLTAPGWVNKEHLLDGVV